MLKLKRIRKLLYAGLGQAAGLALLLPPQAPSKVREAGAVVIALASLFGVYQSRNAPQPQVAPTLFAHRPGSGFGASSEGGKSEPPRE